MLSTLVEDVSLVPKAHAESAYGGLEENLGVYVDVVSNFDAVEYAENVRMGSGNDLDVDPFIIVDLGEVERQKERWFRCFPRIRPFYAVKCNPNPTIVRTLVADANGGASGLDCASKPELELALKSGVPPQDIIFANACKMPGHICFARSKGIKKMTFDNSEELDKIARYFPEAECIIRILADDSHSVCRLGRKFGCRVEDAQSLLEHAQSLSLNVVGLSFHVGSGCYDTSAYADALERAQLVFDTAKNVGFNFNLLDIGGGFPGEEKGISVEQIADVINPILDTHFNDVQIISEPGRYFVTKSHTLFTNVYSRRREGSGEDEHCLLYINDGVYGSLNCIVQDHRILEPIPLPRKTPAKEAVKCTVFGPTCDSYDTVMTDVTLPLLEIGDWIGFKNLGAYSVASSCAFNGFHTNDFLYVRSLEYQ